MTAIVVIENVDINESIVVGKEILKMYGTNIYVQEGEIITIRDLLYGLLLRSGNDAAVVLATYVGGTEEKFVEMMNEKAKLLGMENTKFQNPHGLDEMTENYSTAYDMALLSSYAQKNNTYKTISQTKKHTTATNDKSYIWYNRNKLLSQYEFCTGGKNGYTPKAGKTLVTTAYKDDMELTAVTLNIPDMYNYHKNLYEQSFRDYKMYQIIDKDKFKLSSNSSNTKLIVKKSFYYPLTTNEFDDIKTEINYYPEKQKNIIGYITIKLHNKKIGMLEIYETVQKKEDKNIFLKLKTYLFDILKKFILGRQNNLKPGPLVPIPPDTYNFELSMT